MPYFLVFQGKLASEQHIRELCGSMIDGEKIEINLVCRTTTTVLNVMWIEADSLVFSV